MLPLLEEINPKAVEHMAETAELLSAEEDFLELQAAACYEKVKADAPKGEVRLKRKELQVLHPAMRRRVLRKAMEACLSADFSQAQIEALEDLLQKETGKSRDFLEGVHAENRYDVLVLTMKKERAEGYRYLLPLGESVFISETGLRITAWTGEKGELLSEDTKCFDFDKIHGELFCRSRKTGDVISLKNGRKKIKDLFIDEKIPRNERETFPLIAVGEEVLWAVGLRVSEKFQLDEYTKKYLYVKTEKA